MANFPHSSAPWRVEWIGNSIYIKSGDSDKAICRVMSHRSKDNLSLLLHAPGLLDALEAIIDADSSGDGAALEDAIYDAITVVKRAKGE